MGFGQFPYMDRKAILGLGEKFVIMDPKSKKKIVIDVDNAAMVEKLNDELVNYKMTMENKLIFKRKLFGKKKKQEILGG